MTLGGLTQPCSSPSAATVGLHWRLGLVRVVRVRVHLVSTLADLLSLAEVVHERDPLPRLALRLHHDLLYLGVGRGDQQLAAVETDTPQHLGVTEIAQNSEIRVFSSAPRNGLFLKWHISFPNECSRQFRLIFLQSRRCTIVSSSTFMVLVMKPGWKTGLERSI